MAKKNYNVKFIYRSLERVLFCSLATFSEEGNNINGRFMIFACDKNLEKFYFLSHRDAAKIKELKKNPKATICILSTADMLDDYSETIVKGIIKMEDNFSDKEVQKGLKLMAKRTRMLEMLIRGSSLRDYRMLTLTTEEITFRIYKDILDKMPKTIIRLKNW